MKIASIKFIMIILLMDFNLSKVLANNYFKDFPTDTIPVLIHLIYADSSAGDLKEDNSFREILKTDFKKRGDKQKKSFHLLINDAAFYQPDYVLNFSLLNLQIGEEKIDQNTRLASRTISKTIFDLAAQEHKVRNEDVQADVVHIKKTVTCSMEIRMDCLSKNDRIFSKAYSEVYTWDNEYITYSGSKDALTTDELQLAKNKEKQVPVKSYLIKNLEQKIFNAISAELDKLFKEKR